MDYNMTLLLLVLVGMITYILFTPDNWFTRKLDEYCCDDDHQRLVDECESIKMPSPVPIAPDKLEPQEEEDCPLKPKPKKKRSYKKKNKPTTTKRKPKPRKSRKSNNK